jgi:hypothetical protein
VPAGSIALPEVSAPSGAIDRRVTVGPIKARMWEVATALSSHIRPPLFALMPPAALLGRVREIQSPHSLRKGNTSVRATLPTALSSLVWFFETQQLVSVTFRCTRLYNHRPQPCDRSVIKVQYSDMEVCVLEAIIFASPRPAKENKRKQKKTKKNPRQVSNIQAQERGLEKVAGISKLQFWQHRDTIRKREQI